MKEAWHEIERVIFKMYGVKEIDIKLIDVLCLSVNSSIEKKIKKDLKNKNKK